MKIRHRILSAAVAAVVAITGLTATTASASSTSNLCEFGVFIGVRGTGAPAGSSPVHSNRVWRSGGYGDQIDSVRARLASSGIPYYMESLNYPASLDYNNSMYEGRRALVAELNWLAEQCTYLPAVVLAGHSQGADVISAALTDSPSVVAYGPNLSAKAKASIRAVALFGDPKFKAHQIINASGAATDSDGRLGARSSTQRAQLDSYRTWGWAQGANTTGPSWLQQIRSYCLDGDFFCNNDLNDFQWNSYPIHNSYRSKGLTTQAADWMEYMLTDLN